MPFQANFEKTIIMAPKHHSCSRQKPQDRSTGKGSRAQSGEDCEPDGVRRTNSGKVIIYDPATQELKRQRIEDLDSKCSRHRQTQAWGTQMLIAGVGKRITYRGRAPNMGSRTAIYADQNSSLLVASVKLSNLGWQASWQRFCGRCNDVYTINSIPATVM